MNPPTHRPTKEEMRQRIMTTAESLCRTLGYNKMTVADIAAELGISPAYIYKFFSSKRSLIQTCADQSVAEEKKHLWAASQAEGSTFDRLEYVLKAAYAFHRERLAHDKHIYRLIITAQEEMWPCIRNFDDFLLQLVTDLVEVGRQKGEFQIDDPLEAARTLLDSFTWIIHPLLFRELPENGVEERITAQLRLLEKGLKSFSTLAR